jgi:hypothetical protein
MNPVRAPWTAERDVQPDRKREHPSESSKGNDVAPAVVAASVSPQKHQSQEANEGGR